MLLLQGKLACRPTCALCHLALQAEGQPAEDRQALLCAGIGQLLQPTHWCVLVLWLLLLLQVKLLDVLLLWPCCMLLLLLQVLLRQLVSTPAGAAAAHLL